MYSTFPKSPGSLLSDGLMSYQGHLLMDGLTPQQRCSWCILQPQPTGPQDTCWEVVLPLCRDTVDKFFSPSQMGLRTFGGGWSYPSAEMQSVYSTVPTKWAIEHLLGGGVTPLQRCSRYIPQLELTGLKTMWNAKSLVKDLNLGCWVHLQWT